LKGAAAVPKLSSRLTAQFVALLSLFAVSLMVVAGVAVWGLEETRSTTDALYSDHLQTAQLTANVGQELDDTYETAQALLLATDQAQRADLTLRLFTDNVPAVEVLLSDLQRAHARDPENERVLVAALVSGWAQFRTTWSTGSLLAASPSRAGTEAQLDAAFGPIEGVTDELQTIEQQDAGQAHRRGVQAYFTSLWLIGGVTGAGLLLGVAFVLLMSRRVLPRALAPERDQAEFAEAMQLAGGVEEAQALLKRHLERVMPKSSAVVLNRDPVSRQLEAVTPLADDSPLHATLTGVSENVCVAIRTSRRHRSGDGSTALLPCRVCDGCPGTSICTPLTAGGQIIGSVLVTREEPLELDDNRRIRDSINQAAPVLANLRNLATAELQALTDALTDLPNKRSVHDTLTRMAAQATRARTPLAVLSVDLDHFKKINDTYGHGVGDDVLAAVGAVLRSSLRTSDFAGRNGGEEFLLLLPSTDSVGALALAEKLRLALREINVSPVGRPITASIGVAVLPDHAGEAGGLELAADQALYSAKRNGRDRVELASMFGAVVDPLSATDPQGADPVDVHQT
jgi:diguanylate cyclase (GGDEF)-like protein